MSNPIQPLLDSITAMEGAFSQPSCQSGQPFVKYPDTGNPPTLSFNVPQSTAFTTYGHLLKYFPASYFKPFTKLVPENNFYDMVKTMNTEQAQQLFHPNVMIGPYKSYPMPTGVQLHANGPVIPLYNPGLNASAYGLSSHTSTTNGTATTAALSPKVVLSGMPPLNAQQNFAAPSPVPAASQMANFAMQQLRPLEFRRLNGLAPVTKYVYRPPVPVPRIVVIEEYTTVSYLGNYGAGRVVKTFSLLPGERTTISVRTYKDRVSTVESSKNVLDSFSNSSAAELDTLLQHEQGDLSSTSDTSGGSGSSFSTTTDTKNSSKSFGISGGIHLGPISVGGGYGQSQSSVTNSSSGFNNAYDYNHTGVRQSNVNALDTAINKSVQQSNANRQIDVNTSTSDTSTSGEEDTTVRELKNVNQSRVLNFTFRQLLQEYTVITYLSNVKFAYTNGYAESYTLVDLSNLPNMLADIIDTTVATNMTNVLCKLLQPYCGVMNYNDTYMQFIEKIEVPVNDCLQIGGACVRQPETIYRVKKTCIDTYKDDVVDVKVKGVILSVKKQVLQTSSVVADALLGRGEALDCFNQNAQNADTIASHINNLQNMQRLEDDIQAAADRQVATSHQVDMNALEIEVVQQQTQIINHLSLTNPLDAATNYKKVFSYCCNGTQPCCGGGCGCNCKHKHKP